MAQLPTADEFFGAAPGRQLPTADEFFGKPARTLDGSNEAPASSPEADEAWFRGPARKVLDAFGEGFGPAEIGLSQETVKAARENGWFNDYEKGHNTTGKALNEVLLRPSAYALDVFLRGTAGAFRAGQEAVRLGIEGVGGDPRLARDVAAMPEAFFGGPGSFGPRPMPRVNLSKARNLKVIGHGEGGWRGTSTKLDEATPEVVTRSEEAPVAAIPEAPPVKPIEEQRAFIQGDVKEKLIAAGRPETEAEAAAAIDAAYWETRAARFEGKKGTAEEMYLAEGPEIVAGKDQRAVTMAQKGESDLSQSDIDWTPGGGSKTVKIGDTTIDYGISSDGKSGEVILVKTPEKLRGQGSARRAMEEILAKADENGTTLFLNSDPMGKGIRKPKLDAFYESLGFVKNKGKNKDFTSAAEYVRQPKELEQVGDVKRGRIRIREEGRNTITLLREANASTFIHEKGHDYLARLISDAADDLAPAALKADADLTLKWLGVEKAEDIKTKQHEQFARGFEAYVREGVAPTPGLARVFEQFRQWLVRIYESVSRLKVDINDDIRGVFDRMLALEPARIQAIPDESLAAMAMRHEELLGAGKTEEAAILADSIRAERDILAGSRLPGIEDARLSETARGTDGRAPGGAEPRSAEPAPGLDAERAGERPATGAVSASRSEAAAEGALARGDANATLPRGDTPLVDKAGNIRLENLGAPDDVRNVIRQTALENEGFVEARRGVLSDAEVAELADALGMDAKQINRRKVGEAFNAEQVVAARKLLVQSAREVRDLMAKAADGDEASILAYAEAKTRHLMIQEQVSGLTAEAGRALRAFRALEGMDEAKSVSAFLQENTGKTLYQLQREAQLGLTLDTPAKVSKFVRDSAKPDWKDMLIEVWINALLSGPKTHATNIFSNTLVSLYRIPETALAGGIGKVRSAITGNKDRVEFGEAGARLFGFVQGAKDGLRAGIDVLKNEDLVADVSKIEARPRAVPGIAGKIIRAPGRALAAEDAVFRAIAHRQELNSLSYRAAMKEGLEGQAFERRVAELVANPTEDMLKAAKEAADYQTFQTKLGRMGGAVQGFANSHPFVKLVIPFVRTPVNIVKFAQERSLFGLFSKEVRENIAKGGASADAQVARIVLGSALSTTAVALALEGTITGGGPSDPRERAVLYQSGWQPYSVKIGEHYYSYGRMEPIAMLFGIAADMAEIGQVATEEEADSVGKLVLASVAKNLTSKTWLSGPSELIKAVHDPDRYGQRYIQRLAGTVVPTGVAQIAQTQDPYLREARTIIDGIKARIPGMSQQLLPRRDIWGEPIDLGGGLGPDLISPIYESRINNDPVNQSLLRLKVFPSKLSRQIRGVELSDQQYDDFSRLAGRTAKMRLDSVVATPGFSTMPQFAQREIITRTIDTARETARNLMMMQNPEIIEKAIYAKREALTGKR